MSVTEDQWVSIPVSEFESMHAEIARLGDLGAEANNAVGFLRRVIWDRDSELKEARQRIRELEHALDTLRDE